jgi:hypothetical protein
VDIERASVTELARYGRLCGWTLAHAHARSGDPAAIAGYLGASDAFDRADSRFAKRYAQQNQDDYLAFKREIDAGRLEAAPSA